MTVETLSYALIGLPRPRLRRVKGVWYCECSFDDWLIVGAATTPGDAYECWTSHCTKLGRLNREAEQWVESLRKRRAERGDKP